MNVLPAALRAQLDRVRAYVTDEELEALFRRLADRYAVAKAHRETGEAFIRVKFHHGGHNELRWSGDERITK